jgi:hypothetical protein
MPPRGLAGREADGTIAAGEGEDFAPLAVVEDPEAARVCCNSSAYSSNPSLITVAISSRVELVVVVPAAAAAEEEAEEE